MAPFIRVDDSDRERAEPVRASAPIHPRAVGSLHSSTSSPVASPFSSPISSPFLIFPAAARVETPAHSSDTPDFLIGASHNILTTQSVNGSVETDEAFRTVT
jgi:hypothetical protein